jgi:hypothetical protein
MSLVHIILVGSVPVDHTLSPIVYGVVLAGMGFGIGDGFVVASFAQFIESELVVAPVIGVDPQYHLNLRPFIGGG